MEQILIDNGFKHIRTFGNKKEYERTLGKHKMRVRPSAKSVYIEFELTTGLRRDFKTFRLEPNVAIDVVKAFSVLEVIYG